MTRDDLFAQLENVLEMKRCSLKGSDELHSLPEWDSLSQTNFIVVVEQALKMRFSHEQFADCRTVDDLIDAVQACCVAN